jgi:hypothetical protein
MSEKFQELRCPEDGGDMFLRNVSLIRATHLIINMKIDSSVAQAVSCRLSSAAAWVRVRVKS